MLLRDDNATAYLRDVRGLSPEIIAKAQIGHNGRGFTIPIKDVRTRELVNLRIRFWPKLPLSGAKYQGLAGHTLENGGVTIYPGMPGGNALVLCAGEFDALVLWRHGLPGITVTSGAATRWRKEWGWMVKGKRVAVIYDADPREEEQALSRAAELRAAGADAWRVRLSKGGLGNGEDITSWFTDQGRSQRELLNLINVERHGKLRRKKVAA
ncbi:MAG TPA: toprim domain-containing protein [Solirubrobacteraceae bacterium]|nr:toprim domain-containing protein [Solirubrobacteraceae bacterium]